MNMSGESNDHSLLMICQLKGRVCSVSLVMWHLIKI